MHLDRVAAITGFARRVELVAHATELRAEVEPDGHALADPDLEVPEGGLGDRGAARDLPDRHSTVRGLRHDIGIGSADRDRPVRALHEDVAGDRVDRGVAVRVLDPGGTVDRADPHRTGTGDELDLAVDPLDGDVTDAGLEVQRTGLVQLDVTDPDLAVAVAEGADRKQRGDPGVDLHP